MDVKQRYQKQWGGRVLTTAALSAALLLVGAGPLFAQDTPPVRRSLDDVKSDMFFSSGESFRIDQLLENWGIRLGHTVIADPNIKDTKVTLLTAETMISWGVFKRILTMYGIVISEEEVAPGQILIKAFMKRGLQTNGPTLPYPVIMPDEELPKRSEIVTALIRVKNGAAREIFNTVRALQQRYQGGSRSGEIQYVQGPEYLIATGFAPTVEYFRSIIQALDIRAPGQKIRIRKLKFAVPSEVSQVLNQLFQGDQGIGGRPIGFQVGAGSQVSQPEIIPHDPTKKLILKAYDYQFEEIEGLINDLDVRVKEEKGKYHIYKCQNANAEELAAKLQELFTNNKSSTSTGRGATTARRGGGQRGPLGRGNTGNNAPNANQSGVPKIVDTRIVADNRINALLIQAEDEDYQAVRRMLRQLDKKRRRVFIEAMVWEISAMDNLTIATELAALSDPAQGRFRPLAATSFGLSDVTIGQNGIGRNVVNRLNQGITAILTKDTFNRVPVIINTLQSVTQSKTITTPFAITNDNGIASFRVTNRQPFNTTTINNVASQQNVQFVDATSTLTIEPQVNSNDNLTLDIELVISSFGARPQPNLPPTTSSREYRGRVTVPNGQYIVFGGLDQQSVQLVENKVPFIGDIPILGYLFKQWQKSKMKTSVYVFVRPVIFFDRGFRDDVRATDFLRKKAHVEGGREEWLPPVVPDENSRVGSLQDKVFEVFGTGSGNPFRRP